jgi:transposase
MVMEDEYEHRQNRNAELAQQLAQALKQMEELQAQLEAAYRKIAELEAKKTPPPAFVKANTPAKPKTERKKRAPEHNQARQCETPTQVIEHAITCCPDCQGKLSSVHVGRTRQVLEIAPPPPLEVIEHRLQRGWCSYCHQWREASVDLHEHVIGQSRFGVRFVATLTTMRMALRLPIRVIQQWLATMYQIQVSIGAITALLQRTATHCKPVAEQLRDHIRASPAVNGDETGWRENGRNGYIWGLGTPDGVCYFEWHPSRKGEVINTILGEDFTGVLTTDFYAGYNDTPCGKHQRCWVHLLRDLHALKENFPQHAEVLAWVADVRQVYYQAVAVRDREDHVRWAQREQGERTIQTFGQQYTGERLHPCQTLAKRLLRHQGELLVFLTAPGVDPDNNRAERLVRPLVVARKISGGSRSGVGSVTHMILASIVSTCQATARNVFHELLRLLQSPLPQF